MIYNLNLGIGWASSGVEYAQVYRAKCLRRAGLPARFLFTDMIRYENIEHLTANIGLLDAMRQRWPDSAITSCRQASTQSTQPLQRAVSTTIAPFILAIIFLSC